MCEYLYCLSGILPQWLTLRALSRSSSVKDSSVIAVQIFDQRKFKRRDQGFLGVVNIPVRDHLDMDVGGQGVQLSPSNSTRNTSGVFYPR